ncbi:MAG: 50S ribosomal protein L4 [Bacteroidota bacterium]
MQLQVLNKNGQETGRTVSLSDAVFGVNPNEHAVWLDVKQYLANQRQGTHKSKERAEINATTKKLKKQKGTGGARAGSKKSPLFVGGGRVFGPRPRDYSFKLNKKLKVVARRSVFSAKVAENNLSVLEAFTFDTPSTKGYLAFLKAFNAENKKTVLIVNEMEKSVYLSSRNLPNATVLTANALNSYELLHADRILVSENSIATIEALLA